MRKTRSLGFTLVELLVVISIIAILSVAVLLGAISQINRGYDAKRKTDLATIKKVFEDYHTDKVCYPPAGTLDNCNGAQLSPYLDSIPCDPQSKEPYVYEPYGNGCEGYRVLVTLQNTNDPAIVNAGCSPTGGCGGYGVAYNYGIAVGTAVYSPPEGTTFACTPQGNCDNYADPVGMGCPGWYVESGCLGECPGNPANWCDR